MSSFAVAKLWLGQNFSTRHTQHEKAAKLTSSADSQKSRFYNSYPSKTVELANNSSRKGEFENLQMLVGMGFDKLLKGKLMNDFASERGIFHFDLTSVETFHYNKRNCRCSVIFGSSLMTSALLPVRTSQATLGLRACWECFNPQLVKLC